MRTFRAATLNIWQRFGPWEKRMVAIRHGLAELAPDIIGLQEVLRFRGFDQLGLLAEAGGGYHGVWGIASENHGYALGNAILSRWPVLRSETIPLPNAGTDESRSLVFAEIDSPYGKIPFFCTHLNWKLSDGHVRVEQVKAVAAAIDAMVAPGSFPPLLVGDFNAEPNADEIRYLKGLTGLGGPCVYYADAFGVSGDGSPGATFSKRNPFAEVLREPERRIDYVFCRGPDDAQRGEPRDARVCFDHVSAEGGVFPSDHFGVMATITAGR